MKIGQPQMHTERPPGTRWPTPDQVAFGQAVAAGLRYSHPKGVVRYRNEDEADKHMRALVAAGVAKVARRRGWFAGTSFRRAIRRLWLAWG